MYREREREKERERERERGALEAVSLSHKATVLVCTLPVVTRFIDEPLCTAIKERFARTDTSISHVSLGGAAPTVNVQMMSGRFLWPNR